MKETMKFIVAVDGSEQSDRALEHAVEIAKGTEADITVVHAVTPEIYSQNGEILIEDMSDAETRADEVLENAREYARELEYEVDTELLYGDPTDEIIKYADEEGFDSIFVGHRGLSQRHEDLVGSVAQEIVRRASIPVTVVR